MQGVSKKKRSWDLFSFSTYKKEFLFCMAAVFIWGLAAHAYGFMQDSFSHDSLNALDGGSTETAWKILIGRYLAPVYRFLTRGAMTVPWSIGLLSLIWIGLAACLIVRMFEIKSRAQIFFIAGILTTNACVSSLTATYIHDLDIDMFALFTGAGAAYLWQKKGWLSLICGGILSAVTLALYQSYIGATAVIILFYCFGALCRGESVKRVWLCALRALAMLAIGGALYFAGIKISASFGSSLAAGAYHSFETLSFPSLSTLAWGVKTAAQQYFGRMLFMHTAYGPAVRLLLCALTLIPVLVIIIRMLAGKISIGAKLTALLTVILVPFASGVACLFSRSAMHELMFYPVYMTYAFALILIFPAKDAEKPKKFFPAVLVCGLCVMLGLNVFTSNGMYLKKDLEQDAALSLMTRMVYRVEEQADYIPGETPVAFFGNISQIHSSPEMGPYSAYVGMNDPVPYRGYLSGSYNSYVPYIKYKLGNTIKLCDTETWYWMYINPEIEAMPVYPAEGSVKMIDGVMCVKVGEYRIPDMYRTTE